MRWNDDHHVHYQAGKIDLRGEVPQVYVTEVVEVQNPNVPEVDPQAGQAGDQQDCKFDGVCHRASFYINVRFPPYCHRGQVKTTKTVIGRLSCSAPRNGTRPTEFLTP